MSFLDAQKSHPHTKVRGFRKLSDIAKNKNIRNKITDNKLNRQIQVIGRHAGIRKYLRYNNKIINWKTWSSDASNVYFNRKQKNSCYYKNNKS